MTEKEKCILIDLLDDIVYAVKEVLEANPHINSRVKDAIKEDIDVDFSALAEQFNLDFTSGQPE